MKKLSKNEVEELFIKNGYTPMFKKYNGVGKKLVALNKDGYKIVVSVDGIKAGKNPSPVYYSNPYSIQNINKWLYDNKKEFVLISDKFINGSSYLKWKCLIDNYLWSATWKNIRRSKIGCPICANEKTANLQRLNIIEIKDKLKNISPTIEILSKEYINNKSEIHCKCLIKGCNHEWMAPWDRLSKGSGCIACSIRKNANNFKLGIQEVKYRLKGINKDIKILSKEYLNSHAKLYCECLVAGCGNRWYVSWTNLSCGKGCPECANRKADGTYTLYLAERNKYKWENTQAIVYTIQCFDEYESFYKIGITTTDVESRFYGNGKMPYKYRLIDKIFTNLYNAVYIEQKLHSDNKENVYSPKIKFGGYTECFSKINI